MQHMPEVIEQTLIDPDEIRRDAIDPDTVRLYLKWLPETPLGSKWALVAVKFLNGDAFVVTSYTTNRRLENEILWIKSTE